MEKIIGFEDYYITTDGRIFNKKNKQMSLHTRYDGYQQVSIRKDKAPHIKYIHRLVAIQYLGDPKEGQEVNHKNGIKNDNRVENLEWVSRSENCIHAKETGLKVPKIESYERLAVKNRTVTEPEELEIKRMAKNGYSFRFIGRQMGYHHKTISGIVNQTTVFRARPDNRNKVW